MAAEHDYGWAVQLKWGNKKILLLEGSFES
jgi:hypothetical protein